MSNSELKVLVADDSSVIQRFFRELAVHSPFPFEPIAAEDGRACLEILNRGDINVAFIDVNMPEMTGIEAVGAARFAGDRTFVAIMSARNSPVRLQLAHALKVYEYLTKPFTEEDVLSILRTYRCVTTPFKGLIVDDSSTARRLVRKVLTNSIFNVEVVEAGDGQAALSLCETGGFDVVFLDCNMPGLNGMETLSGLTGSNPTIKVIMMTATRNDDLRQQALDGGATALLYKPFSSADIDRELHALFHLKPPQLALQIQLEDHPVADSQGWA